MGPHGLNRQRKMGDSLKGHGRAFPEGAVCHLGAGTVFSNKETRLLY